MFKKKLKITAAVFTKIEIILAFIFLSKAAKELVQGNIIIGTMFNNVSSGHFKNVHFQFVSYNYELCARYCTVAFTIVVQLVQEQIVGFLISKRSV